MYWQHGHSTERDFIYVTTANLSHEQLQQLSDEVGPERSLLVLCTAFRGRGEYPNLTVKKIPKQVLSRCEWGMMITACGWRTCRRSRRSRDSRRCLATGGIPEWR